MDIDIAAERSYPVPFVNSTLLPLLLLSLATQKHTPNTAKTFKLEYDYIVVGAGSAGSVVASRLSEIPCVNILLLEAGKSPPLLTEVGGFARSFWFTDIDWQYKTAPQKYTGNALVNRQVIWPSGKALGGSSVLNAMLYVRGNSKNYDDWAAEGAEGWSYKEVLPYFIKAEDNRDPEYLANGYHGVGGPLTVHRPRYQSEIKGPLFEAARYLGHKVVDSNGPRQTGFYDLQASMRSGQRCSTAKAYLVPAEKRENIDILPNAMVRKVIIKNRRAVGVEFDYLHNTYFIRARKEVIMSAGAINTAQLLMLSGIGPRKELERHQIPVIADLPVGKNLQDHYGTNINFELDPSIPPLLSKARNSYMAEYIQNRTGPFGSAEFGTVVTFLKDDLINPKEDFPNHESYFGEATAELGRQFGITPQAYAQLYAPLEGKPFSTCITHMLQPKSRGTVTLQSRDPYDPPIIDPNYYEHPQDVQDVVEGLKSCIRIATSPPMQRVGSVLAQGLVPGCEQYAGDIDTYLECLVRSIAVTLSHEVGTARMGHPEDPRTVVDPLLRVLSIDGLRVVDASIMPIVPSGNTNVPTIMVGEKASDIIKASIQCHANTDGYRWWNS